MTNFITRCDVSIARFQESDRPTNHKDTVFEISCWFKSVVLRFLLLASTTTIFSTQFAHAQVLNLPMLLDASSEAVITTQLGNRIDGITVTAVDINLFSENAARVNWRVEPADAARFETPETTYFTESSGYTQASTSITVLKEGTFYVIAQGVYDRPVADDPNQNASRAIPALELNEVAFTVNAGTSDNTTSETNPGDQAATLSTNQTQVRDGTQSACDALQTEADQGPLSEEQGSLLVSCTSLQLLDDPGIALNRLAPDELFSMGDAIVGIAETQTANVHAHLHSVRAGLRKSVDIDALSLSLWDQTFDSHILSAAPSESSLDNEFNRPPDPGVDSAIGFFASGSVSIGSVNGDGIQHDADISTQGLTIGADYRFNSHVVIGSSIGVVKNDTDFTGDNGDLATEGLSFTAFATWYEADSGHADIILDSGQNAFDLRRRVNLPGQAEEFATGSTDAKRSTLSVSAARTFNKGAWTFGPTLRLHLTRASVDPFQEQSSLGANTSGTTMNIASHRVHSSRMAIGADVSRVVNTRWGVLVPVVRAEYELESENDKGEIQATFVHDPSATPMRFTGTERDDSYFNLIVGTTAVFARSISAFAFYESRTQNDYVSQTRLNFGLRMHF
jgi:uncharacterized protein YhjY with autotransporter beta-barrel domain